MSDKEINDTEQETKQADGMQKAGKEPCGDEKSGADGKAQEPVNDGVKNESDSTAAGHETKDNDDGRDMPEEKESQADKPKKRSGFIKGAAFGAAAVLVVELALSGVGSDNKFNILKIDTKLKEIESLIDSSYLYDADKDTMTDAIFSGVLYGLTEDNYSEYYSAEYYAEEKKRLNGNYVGIGVTISKDEATGGILVNEVNAGGPAEAAGIQTGDIIIEADGRDLTSMTTNEVVGIITGEVGTTVDIKLLRDGKEYSYTVERANITTVSVQSDVLDKAETDAVDSGSSTSIKGTNIGYISITSFNQATRQEFMDQLDELTEDKQVDGIIIDLRNNGGGDLNICLEMLDMILPDDIKPVNTEGEAEENGADAASDTETEAASDTDTENGTLLLSIEDKNGDATTVYANDGWSVDVPIVVVVNGNSASASEIFAGTLRDYGYQIVGENTFGKGIVQSLYELSDGSAVKFTTEQYRLAGGELIHGKGIEPTIEVAFEEYDGITAAMVNSAAAGEQQDLMKDNQIEAAVKELKRQVYEAYQKQ